MVLVVEYGPSYSIFAVKVPVVCDCRHPCCMHTPILLGAESQYLKDMEWGLTKD